MSTPASLAASSPATNGAANTNQSNNIGNQMTLRSGKVAGQASQSSSSSSEEEEARTPRGQDQSTPGGRSQPDAPREVAVLVDIATTSGLPLAPHLYNEAMARAVVRDRMKKVPRSTIMLGQGGILFQFDTHLLASKARRELQQMTSWMGTPVRIGTMLLTRDEALMMSPAPPPPTFNPAVPPPPLVDRREPRTSGGEGGQEPPARRGRRPSSVAASECPTDTLEALEKMLEGPPEPKRSGTLASAQLNWGALSLPALAKKRREFGTSSAKPVGKPITFCGDSGPKDQAYADWRFAIEGMCCGFKEEVVRQTILATVAGTPMAILRRLGERASVDQMLEALDVAFGQVSSHDTLEKKLYSIQQETREDVTSYMARVNLAVEAIETQFPEFMWPEKAIVTTRDRFFNGLRPDLRNALRVKYEDGSQSYTDLFRSARAIENEHRAEQAAAASTQQRAPSWKGAKAAAVVTATEDTLAAKMANLESRLSRYEQDRSRSPARAGGRDRSRSSGPTDRARRERILAQTEGRGCFRCGKLGHLVAECTETIDFEGKTLPGNGPAGKDSGSPSPANPSTA